MSSKESTRNSPKAVPKSSSKSSATARFLSTEYIRKRPPPRSGKQKPLKIRVGRGSKRPPEKDAGQLNSQPENSSGKENRPTAAGLKNLRPASRKNAPFGASGARYTGQARGVPAIEGADAPYEDWLCQYFYPLPVPTINEPPIIEVRAHFLSSLKKPKLPDLAQ